MSPTAIILIIISAGMHAAWNLRSKSRSPSPMFFLATCVWTVIIFSPVVIHHADKLPAITTDVWKLLIATSFAQAVYFIGLGAAYRAGDMSIAYPLARSSPVIVVTFVSLVLGRGDQISSLCVAGIVLVVAGCFILPMRRFNDFRLSNYMNVCCLMALLAAFGTAGYSIIDDEALRRMRDSTGGAFDNVSAPMVYIVLQAATTSSWLGLFMLIYPGQRGEFAAIMRRNKRHAAVMAVMICVTYSLVLASMAFAKDVSYVVGFRQLSIPIGAMLGVWILREPCPKPKMIGIAVLLAGLVMVAVG